MLLRVMNDILLNMNQQRVTLLVLLELSAAFDKVDHAILLDRLHFNFGIAAHAHSWFKPYLHHRFQSIFIPGGTSKRFEVKYGVSQGSCLGPLLFVLYANNLFTIIERSLPDVHAYANDTELYIPFNANSDEQPATLENM